jgi:hypothetical protein
VPFRDGKPRWFVLFAWIMSIFVICLTLQAVVASDRPIGARVFIVLVCSFFCYIIFRNALAREALFSDMFKRK